MNERKKEYEVGKSIKICFACGEKLESDLKDNCPYCGTKFTTDEGEFNPY